MRNESLSRRMKTDAKKPALTLGDFVAAAYRALGSRRANGFVRLAVSAHILVCPERGRQRFAVSEEQHDNLSFGIKRE